MGLTNDQAIDLSQKFRNIADSLKNFKFKNWQFLSTEQRESINNTQLKLYDYSQEIITQAVKILVNEAYNSLEDLKRVIAKANHAIENLNEITHVLKIASTIVGLCSTIIYNSRDIFSAIDKVTESIENYQN